MIRHPLRIIITALSFYIFFPLFAGISFLGNVLEAFGLAAALTLACSILYLLTDAAESLITRAVREASIPKGLPVLLLYWLATYVLLPGLLLKAASALVPGVISVHGAGSVLVGGLILFLIGYFTGAYDRQPESCKTCITPGKPDDAGSPSSPENGDRKENLDGPSSK